MYYPIFLNLQDRPVLVVGGGTVAERKVETLLDAGARVTVISLVATPELRKLATAGRIALQLRRFSPSDLKGAVLVISATDDSAVQAEVAALAAERNVPVNTVDKPELCSFIVPAILRKGEVTVAISTSGSSPSLAAALRARIGTVVTDDVARAASILKTVRTEVHQRFADSEERKRVFDSIIESGIIEWIASCDDTAALQRVRRMIREFQ